MENLVIVTTEDLITQNLVSGKDILAQIKNPTDSADIRLLELAKERPYLMEFDSVHVLSRQSRLYPNPTLNHYALARYLRKSNVSAHKAIDLGCGVGFLGNYAAVHLGAREIVFSDLHSEALNQSLMAFQINQDSDLSSFLHTPLRNGARFSSPSCSVEARLGPSQDTMHGYDGEDGIALSAPMYLPGICEIFPQAFDVFAYTAKNIGARLYIGHSSLAKDLVESAADRFSMSLNARNEQTVPFIAEYADNGSNRASLDELVKKGLVVKGKELYHDLMVSELR
jgi:hypothetical protein